MSSLRAGASGGLCGSSSTCVSRVGGNTSTRGEWLLCTLRVEGMRLIAMRGSELVYRNDQRGIRPLLEMLASAPEGRLRGASFADTVVGKASALLLTLAGASFVATDLLSDAAAELLVKQGVLFYARERVAQIAGRVPGRPCPFEESVALIEEPAEALKVLAAVQEKFRDQGSQHGPQD